MFTLPAVVQPNRQRLAQLRSCDDPPSPEVDYDRSIKLTQSFKVTVVISICDVTETSFFMVQNSSKTETPDKKRYNKVLQLLIFSILSINHYIFQV